MSSHDQEPRFVSDEARELIRGLENVSNDLSSLAAFMRAAEALRNERPDAATEQKHLAAIAAETARVRAGASASSAKGSTLLGVARSRWFKGAAIGLAAVFTTGGLAAARVLPPPAQNAVAAVAQAIGIDIPRADEARDPDDFDGDGIPNGSDPTPGGPLTQDPLGDADGDGIVNGEDPDAAKVKDGLDHDGDGIPDDSGNHAGQPKDGLDHDGDGAPDDSGNHGQPSTPPGQETRTPKPTKTPKPEKTEKPDAPSQPDANPGANGQDTERTARPEATAKPTRSPKVT